MPKTYLGKFILGVSISLATMAIVGGITSVMETFDDEVEYVSMVEDEEKHCFHLVRSAIKGRDATCTASGLTEGLKCASCGEVLIKQERIPALGHNIVPYDGQPPTCTESGYNTYEACTRCTYTTYMQLPATGHVDNNSDFFCDSCGIFDGDTASMSEVDVVAGELAVGNWYRLYRPASGCTDFKLSGMLWHNGDVSNTASFEGPQLGYCGSWQDYYVIAETPSLGLEGYNVVITNEYIDIYVKAGTYNVISKSAYSVTIPEDATVLETSELASIKRLVKN